MAVKLDLKKFKHLKSDDRSTTLIHPAGHTITLAHDSLSPENKQQLEALSKIPSQSETSTQMRESVNKMADGGEASNQNQSQDQDQSQSIERIDPTKAKEFMKGYDQPTTAQEAWQNIKSEASNWFKAEGGEIAAPKSETIGSLQTQYGPGRSYKAEGGPIKQMDTRSKFEPQMQMQNGGNVADKKPQMARSSHAPTQEAIQPMRTPAEIVNSISAENNDHVGGTIRDGSRDEIFVVGNMIFHVEPAKKISKNKPNCMVKASNAWSEKINVEEDHAIKSESPNPVLIAQIPTEDGLQPLLFDGHHRMYKAMSEGRNEVPGYLFTPEESLAVMSAPPDLMYKLRNNLKKVRGEVQQFAKGGRVQRYADGGQTDAPPMPPGGFDFPQQYTPTDQPQVFGFADKPGPSIGEATRMGAMSAADTLADIAGIPANPQTPVNTAPNIGQLIDPAANVTPPLPKATDAAIQAMFNPPEQEKLPSEAAQAAPPKAKEPSLEQSEQMLEQGIQEVPSALSEKAKALGDLGKVQQDIINKRLTVEQAAQNTYNANFNALNNERAGFIDDIRNNFINPDKYWTGDPATGQGGHSKMLTGIGMILAGFNPTSNPNAAVNFLKFQMEQNMTAQAKNLQERDNLLAHNLQQFGNLHDAAMMTRIQNNDMMSHQLDAAAAAAQTPIQAAAAKAASGQFKMEAANQVRQFAMYRSMMGMFNPQAQTANTSQLSPEDKEASWQHMNRSMMLLNPEMAKQMAERHVPFVGDASIPVPGDVRGKITSQQNLNRLLGQAANLAQQSGTATSWDQIQGGRTLVNEITSALRTAEDQGVYKESDAKFLQSTIGSNPASWSAAWTSSPRLQELIKVKQADYNTLLKNYGLPAQEIKAQGQPQYKIYKGVKYMRGPKGEAIPVK